MDNVNCEEIKNVYPKEINHEDPEFEYLDEIIYEEIETPIGFLDTRHSEELTDPIVVSKNLDTYENYPEIPTGIKDGVIAKIPIVLAQLNMPIHIKHNINLLWRLRVLKKA